MCVRPSAETCRRRRRHLRHELVALRRRPVAIPHQPRAHRVEERPALRASTRAPGRRGRTTSGPLWKLTRKMPPSRAPAVEPGCTSTSASRTAADQSLEAYRGEDERGPQQDAADPRGDQGRLVQDVERHERSRVARRAAGRGRDRPSAALRPAGGRLAASARGSSPRRTGPGSVPPAASASSAWLMYPAGSTKSGVQRTSARSHGSSRIPEPAEVRLARRRAPANGLISRSRPIASSCCLRSWAVAIGWAKSVT